MLLKTKPPPGAKISHRRRTCSRTSATVPNGSTFCVSTPPPQKVRFSPYNAFNCSGSIPVAEHCTGLRMSNPASTNDGKNLITEPQECLKVFHSVWEWIQSLTCL